MSPLAASFTPIDSVYQDAEEELIQHHGICPRNSYNSTARHSSSCCAVMKSILVCISCSVLCLYIGFIFSPVSLTMTAPFEDEILLMPSSASSEIQEMKVPITPTDEESSIENEYHHDYHDGGIMVESGLIQQIPYYYCNNFVARSVQQHENGEIEVTATDKQPSPGSIIDIVLLHGSKYTKEDWKRSGVLSYFCNATFTSIAPAVRVIALDLPVTTKHEQLRSVLDELTELLQIHPNFPIQISGLVTPSASGSIVMDWFLNDNGTQSLQKYVKSWIPVASNGVLHLSKETMRDTLSNMPILSIYGDLDSLGKRSSDLLQQSTAKTTVQELPGRHAVYLDSPKEFVATILDYLVQQNPYRIR